MLLSAAIYPMSMNLVQPLLFLTVQPHADYITYHPNNQLVSFCTMLTAARIAAVVHKDWSG